MKETDGNKYRTLLMAKREEIAGKSPRREDLWIVPSNEQIETVQLAGQREFAARTLEREAKSLKQIGDLKFPVFYMNYNLYPQVVPWKDSISRTVKLLKGTEYTITRPRDLWFSVTEMVSRIVKSKHSVSSSFVSTQ